MPFPGEIVTGELISAAELNSLPGGVLGYATRSTNHTGIASEFDLPGLSVAVTVAADRRIRITGHVLVRQRTSAGLVIGQIKESTTLFGRYGIAQLATDEFNQFDASAVVVSPSEGAHTYKLTLQTDAGTVDTDATSARPHFILVEDIGSSA